MSLKQVQKSSNRGGKRPNSGMKKGTKMRKTLEWEEFGKRIRKV